MDLSTSASVAAAIAGVVAAVASVWLVWDSVSKKREEQQTRARLTKLIDEVAASSATTQVEGLLVTEENESAVELGVRKGILRTTWSGTNLYVSRKRH